VRHLSFSNVVSLVALFVALGGSAYALSNNSVKSRHIDNGQVRTEDLDDSAVTGAKINAGAVKSSDVGDGELTGDDVDESTLYRAGAGPGQDTFTVPVAGLLSAQIRDIGGDGADLFGGVTGRSTATVDFAAVATGTAFDTDEMGNMRVRLVAPLAAGQSRTFTLVRTPSLTTPLIDTPVACTIGAGESECVAQVHQGITNPFIAIEIESSGAGLASGDDAYIGLYAKQKADL
jgi:hypothetical protein